MLKFAEAYLSENGGINGAKGDQANEIRVSNIYEHKLGWRKFRHPDRTVAYWIGQNALNIALNQHFGYGQNDRGTGYNACKNAGWEPRNVNVNCNLDCSEMVRAQIACALERDVPDFYTGNESGVLLSLGFREVINGSMEHGDIWVTSSTGHTGTIVEVGGDVVSQPNVISIPDVEYCVKTKFHGWLPPVTNDTDYAGIEGDPIVAFMIRRKDGGPISYNVSTTTTGNYLGEVTGYDKNDYNNGFAGDGKTPIDAIDIDVDGYTYHYKVSTVNSTGYLAEVSDDTQTGGNSYAGIQGQAIDKIIVRKG